MVYFQFQGSIIQGRTEVFLMEEGQKTFFDNFPKVIKPDDILNIEILIKFAENIVAFCGNNSTLD